MKQLKVKVLRAQQKNGVPLFIQKRREQFGTFNKVKKLRKVVRFTLPPVTPLRRFQKVVKVVMANNKTKKWREDTRVINVKLPEKIQQIVMTEQRFPKFPSVRKGREGESLSTQEKNELSERIKLINTEFTKFKSNKPMIGEKSKPPIDGRYFLMGLSTASERLLTNSAMGC